MTCPVPAASAAVRYFGYKLGDGAGGNYTADTWFYPVDSGATVGCLDRGGIASSYTGGFVADVNQGLEIDLSCSGSIGGGALLWL